MNVANLSPPGCVDVEFVPGATVNVALEGALKTIFPDPPFPPDAPPWFPPPPAPPPVFA